jgi:hypothetical protein
MLGVVSVEAVEAVIEDVETPKGRSCDHEEEVQFHRVVKSKDDGEQKFDDCLSDSIVSIWGTDEGADEGVFTVEEYSEQNILVEDRNKHPRCQDAKYNIIERIALLSFVVRVRLIAVEDIDGESQERTAENLHPENESEVYHLDEIFVAAFVGILQVCVECEKERESLQQYQRNC